MDSATIPRDFQKDGFPQSCEQGDNICQIKWYNDVCLRKTYTIKHWLKCAQTMLEWQFDNQWSKNEMSTINFKAIWLLELLNSRIIVQLSVFRLETTRGPRKNGDGEKYHCTKMSCEVVKFLRHT